MSANVVVVTIDGTNRTSQVVLDSLQIDNLMAAASTAAFTVNTGTYTPTAWDEVIITIDSTRVFGGYVVARTATGIGGGDNKVAQWAVECRDYTMLLDKVLLRAVAFGATVVTDKTIVQYIFNTYLASDSFNTTTYVSQCYYGVTIGFDNMTVRQALDKLAEYAGAQWFIDCNKNVWWFDRFSPPAATISIDTVAPNGTTIIDPLPDFASELDDSTIVNRLTVYGGYVQGEQLANQFVADGTGTQTTFGPLTQRPFDVVQLTVVDGATTLDTFYGERIGYVPEHVIYTTGLTSNQREVLVDRDAKTVRVAMGRPSLTPGYPPPANAIIALVFHKAAVISATVNDAASQTAYGRVLEHQIYRPDLSTTAAATEYATTWLTKYGTSQAHISFTVDKFGLQPGAALTVNMPVLGITAATYLIQSVAYACIPMVGGVLARATVLAGEYAHSLLDMLKPVFSEYQAPTVPVANQLSDISPVMGEIVAGRAVLTDGGTAQFAWDAYHAHTGVVVGLDPDYNMPQGELLVLQGGTVKAKLGYMVGMGTVGTVTPTGWGIWTQNGYFQGIVAASTITGGTVSGGTITGSYISGGTVTGALVTGGTANFTAGSIGGFRIETNKIWSDNGTIQTGSVVNSSNSGVRMASDGLYGYGSVGQTFALYSDGRSPWFSSGTILNTVYEINTAAVLRTGTVNPRVQIDSSGIFAYPSGPILTTPPKVSIDAATGVLTAVDGIFSGSISASTITGGTVSGGLISGGTVSGGYISGGTVSGGLVSGGTVSGAIISGGTVSGNSIIGGTINASNVAITNLNANNITSGTISSLVVNGGTVSGAIISGGTVSGNSIIGGTINASNVAVTNLNANNITSGTISSLVVNGGSVSGVTFNSGSVTIASTGMELATNATDRSLYQNAIRWLQDGTIHSYVAGGYDTYYSEYCIDIGADWQDATDNGIVFLNGKVSALYGFLTDIIPSTSNTIWLGNSTHSYRGIYLYDTGSSTIKNLQIVNGAVVIT